MRSYVEMEEVVGEEGGGSGMVLPLLQAGETIDFELEDVSLSFYADASKAIDGRGKLYVTSKRVLWIGESASFDFDVPYIVLHAITRDVDSYPTPCLYCQLDEEEAYVDREDDEEEEEEEGDVEGEDIEAKEDTSQSALGTAGAAAAATASSGSGAVSGSSKQGLLAFRTGELFLSPRDEESLRAIFDAFSNAAMLNPDPEEEGHEGEENGDELIFNQEEVSLGAEQARALAHLESVFIEPNSGMVSGQFDDAMQEE